MVAFAANFSARTHADSITVYVGSALTEFDPHHAITFADHAAANILHEGLIAYDGGGQLVPGLAESWVISDDARTYTFSLRSDLAWSDGRDLNAADVVAGIERALDPARRAPFAAVLFNITNAEAYFNGTLVETDSLGVTALDSRTVVFSLSHRDVDFLHVLTHPVAKPVPAIEPDAIATGRVTSGAYVLGGRDNEGVALKAVGRGPNLRLQPSASVVQAWRDSAQTDAFLTAAFPIVTVPPVGDRSAEVRADGGEVLYAYAVNATHAPFNTLEVRHALAMAINRAAILEQVPIAEARPATQFVPPSAMTFESPYRAPFAVLTFEEREAVAAALLSEQGYGVNQRFTVRLRLPDGDIHHEVATAVAELWARAGIDTQIIQAPLPEHWQALYEGDFDVAFVAWPGRRDTPRDGFAPISRVGGPWNFPRYGFPDFSDRLDRASESLRDDVRASHYREAEKALIEDQSLLALFFYRPLALVSLQVRGWQTNTVGIHPLATLSLANRTQKLNLIRPIMPRAFPSLSNTP